MVAAYEEITVPAGSFKAFRLESTPAENSGVRKILWYAPEIQLYVKRVSERGPGVFRVKGALISVHAAAW